MPYVQCNTCYAIISVKAKMPLELVYENGEQVVVTNYCLVFEHMRDNHPEEWNEKLVAEYEEHKIKMGEK